MGFDCWNPCNQWIKPKVKQKLKWQKKTSLMSVVATYSGLIHVTDQLPYSPFSI